MNSILYQRGIYPPEDFEHKKQYGLPMFLAKDAGLKKYLNDVVNQLSSTRFFELSFKFNVFSKF